MGVASQIIPAQSWEAPEQRRSPNPTLPTRVCLGDRAHLPASAQAHIHWLISSGRTLLQKVAVAAARAWCCRWFSFLSRGPIETTFRKVASCIYSKTGQRRSPVVSHSLLFSPGNEHRLFGPIRRATLGVRYSEVRHQVNRAWAVGVECIEIESESLAVIQKVLTAYYESEVVITHMMVMEKLVICNVKGRGRLRYSAC